MRSSIRSTSRAIAVALIAVALPAAAGAQGRLGHDRELGKLMLRNVQRDIQKLYFDSTFHGFDLAGRFAQAEEKLKTAESTGQVMDGASLEGKGVTPDELLVPTGEDLAADRDVVLTRAAALAGLEVAEGETLSFLPYEWPTR
jgi:hypothetical protein